MAEDATPLVEALLAIIEAARAGTRAQEDLLTGQLCRSVPVMPSRVTGVGVCSPTKASAKGGRGEFGTHSASRPPINEPATY
jgi:hypothetical protein